ncbi:hypothetical protein WA1_50015 [Scytonema hofmannii PCC 7110]|uniref:Transporter n=1 Tax=Scytonema hofmannii PCC 7110 TaxID=128403 RepID=A0A139WR09_9CYAN|nr:transporter [Scytonema hofmannii]KYC34867.1 hypothetical protein WA1_50015 [Scytonema hofmannii PCC 7110]
MAKIISKNLRMGSVYLTAIMALAHSAITFKVFAVETASGLTIAIANQPTTISSKGLISRHTADPNTLPQLTSVTKPLNLLAQSQVVTEQPNLTQLPYSLKASDLQFDTTSVSAQDQNNLSYFTATNEVSEAVTQQPNQPENPSQPNRSENSPPPDKSQYNLFNPTPKELLRSFNSGRPSKTDTPFTVDSGHFQLEADFVTYTRDVNNSDGIDTKAFQIFIPNIRVGLLNNVDFQIQLQTYNNVRTKFQDGTEEEQSGYGDTTVGLRINFWGNEGGKTAFGMVTSVKFPTSQDNLGNNAIEGGVTFPFALQLSEQWNLGVQTSFALNKNNASSGYNVGFVNSVIVGYSVTEKLGTFFELFTDITTEAGSELVATFDTGITYLIAENLQLDAGVNIGLTQASDDFNPFVGFAVRF